MELVHEQDEVTHVNVVAHAVNDEEEVTPVLGGLDSQGGGQGFVLLIILFDLIFGLCCLLFRLFFLGLLFLVFLCIFLGLFFLFFLLFFRLFFLLFFWLLLLGLFILGFCCRFGFQSFRFLRFFLFSSSIWISLMSHIEISHGIIESPQMDIKRLDLHK